MTTTRQTHPIGQIKKLIDLNGDTTNFDISFQVSSRNKEPFQLLVVDQTTLDNTPELQYKNVDNGTISGNIVQDKNVYQNYFLVLKSDNPCECDIEITKKELPKSVPQIPQIKQTVTAPNNSHSTKKDGFNWVKIFLILGVIVGIGVVLYLYSKKSPEKAPEKASEKPTQLPVESEFRFYSPPRSASPVSSRAENINVKGGNSLLERLKRLNVN